MARHFDGTNDNLSMGSDASIDDFTAKSMLMWAYPSSGGVNMDDDLLSKSNGVVLNPTGWQFGVATVNPTNNSGNLRFTQDFSTTDGTWVTANNTANTETEGGTHYASTYNRSATDNDPVIYVNGSSLALTETGTPLGSSNGDAAQNLKAGEDDGGNNDYSGDMGFLVYDNTIMTAADVNRHRWWGCAPGGPSTVDVWLPMWTDDLKNKGTAGSAADATATGTSMSVYIESLQDTLPRVERAWGSMMGCGR